MFDPKNKGKVKLCEWIDDDDNSKCNQLAYVNSNRSSEKGAKTVENGFV